MRWNLRSVAIANAQSVRHAFEIAENFILSLDPMSANGDAPKSDFDASICFY